MTESSSNYLFLKYCNTDGLSSKFRSVDHPLPSSKFHLDETQVSKGTVQLNLRLLFKFSFQISMYLC